MKCDYCGKEEAVVHIKQVMEDNIKDVYLCEGCARDYGVTPDQSNWEEALRAMMEDLVVRQMENQDQDLCPFCGNSRQHFVTTREAGCPGCYNAFRLGTAKILAGNKQEEDALPEIPSHRGRLPRRLRGYTSFMQEVMPLEGQLQDALDRQDFEAAAVLRDKIKEIKEEDV